MRKSVVLAVGRLFHGKVYIGTSEFMAHGEAS
jgi:hypothetical protein